MDSITVSSSMLIPSAANAAINPSMLNVIWVLADKLDSMKIREVSKEGTIVRLPTARLRNPEGRDDNAYLKTVLKRLTGLQLEGEYSIKDEGKERENRPWGAVLIAQWELQEGGSMVELLLPPAAVHALRAPQTFAKIEVMATYKLGGHSRRLYAALADKKRMRHPFWEYTIEELRLLFDTREKYPKWAKFNAHVLTPALEEINDFGTVTVKMTPRKEGRSIVGVRFDWDWKDPHDAAETMLENERHATARRKDKDGREMPPLSDDEKSRNDFDKADFEDWKFKNPHGQFRQYLDDVARREAADKIRIG